MNSAGVLMLSMTPLVPRCGGLVGYCLGDQNRKSECFDVIE